MNMLVVANDIEPGSMLLTKLRATIVSGQFVHFASTAEEVALFQFNNFSTVYPPLLFADDSGFNSGNLLAGMHLYMVISAE